MKKINLLLVAVISILISCKKEFEPVVFPDPPTGAMVTYRVFKILSVSGSPVDTMNPSSFTRKITYSPGWVDSTSIAVPTYRDTVVSGDFSLTISIPAKRRLALSAAPDSPGKYEYYLPTVLGWETVDGKPSVTRLEIRVNDQMILSEFGKEPTIEKVLWEYKYFFPGLYDR